MVLEAQNVGISATGALPDNSAGLDINFNDRGLLVPRVSLSSNTSTTAITPSASSPATSLLVYNTNASMAGGNGVGFYYWDGTKWVYIPAPSNGPGSTGQVLTSQGASAPPQWSTLSVSGGGGPTGCASCISMISSYDASTYTWDGCREKCRNLTEGGYTDWRMPTWDEAVYYGSGAFNPPGGTWHSTSVWTSTPWDARVAGTPSTGYWVVFYESNGNWGYILYTNSNKCLCVR